MNQLIGSLITTCKHISLNIADDTESSIKALVILSMRSIDHKIVLQNCLPGVYVDWHMVTSMFGENTKNPLVSLFWCLFVNRHSNYFLTDL
jgi:hypothetical protein